MLKVRECYLFHVCCGWPGETVSVESRWVLSLSLKALLKSLHSSQGAPGSSGSEGEDEEAGAGGQETRPLLQLYKQEFVQCVVYLASLGTGFSKQWLLKDLQVSDTHTHSL